MTRRRTTERRPEPRDRGALLVYTAVTTIVGLGSLVWAAATFPIDDAISLTAAGGREGILLGLVFWIAIGLLGGTRVERMQGHGVLTFHLPFIIAAIAVGGPAAGGIVALVSTIERRELREVPWYGTVANHAHLTLSAVVGGVVLIGIEGTLGTLLPDKPQAVALIAIIAGGALLTLIAISLAAGTVHLRDGLTRNQLTRLYDTSYRATAATEVVLGWILAYTYTALGWWAALVAAILVLAVWQSHDATTISHHDPMTGLLNRSGFDIRLTQAIDDSQRHDRLGALLAIDLDGFKAINDLNGHPMGDEVLRVVGERLQASIRMTDAARLGGDEFGVLLVDLPNVATARRLAKRVHDAIAKPMDIDGRAFHVGASIGVYLIERARKPPTTGLVLKLADQLMYEAKAAGGGVRFSDRAGDVLHTPSEGLAPIR